MIPRFAKRPSSGWVFLFLVLLFCSGCQSRDEGLRVFCAASLGKEVELLCKEQGWDATVHQGGSYTLSRQIQQGARADLFLSADHAAAGNLAHGNSLQPFLGNRLVVIAPSSSLHNASSTLTELLHQGRGRVALGDPATAPLGRYTEQALEGQGLATERTLLLKDARAVLSAVALGHAELGIVYRSDATGANGVKVLAEIPPDSHQPIIYTAVLLSPENEKAKALLTSLRQGRGRELLISRGFSKPD